MMISAFPLEDFEVDIQWFSEVLGNKNMLLLLDYPTLRQWLRENLQVSTFQETHHLTVISPQILLSTF